MFEFASRINAFVKVPAPAIVVWMCSISIARDNREKKVALLVKNVSVW